MRTTILGVGALALAGCTGHDVVVGAIQEVGVLKVIPNRDLDVLFVIDNSPSMLGEQQSLAANFPRMIDALQTLDAGMPNLHIGIVTSDMGTTGSDDPDVPAPPIGSGPGACMGKGDDGALVQGAAITGRYIEDVELPDGTRLTNYTGALRDAFSQVAVLGDSGCGFEQHLRSMQRALDNNPVNAGFVRPEANLAVVILADEDDCSVASSAIFGPDVAALGPLQSFRCFRFGVECVPDDPTAIGGKTQCAPRTPVDYIDDVAPFADFLVALKGDPRKVMVAGVLGDPTPVAVELAVPPGGGTPIPTLGHSCRFPIPGSGEIDVADPAVRLANFLHMFPGRSKLTSICSPDLSGALGAIGTSTRELMGDLCIDTSGLADTSIADGIQPACQVVDVRDSAPDQPFELPACNGGATDCFDLVADPRACPDSPDHARLVVHRSVVTDDMWTHVSCQVAR
jgi:hypothetical protein